MRKSTKIGIVIFIALAVIILLNIMYNLQREMLSYSSDPLPSADGGIQREQKQEPKGQEPKGITGELLSLATKPVTMPTALIALGACVVCVKIGREEE